MKSFEERMRAHNKAMNEDCKDNDMYKYIKENFEEHKFCMRPLVEIETRVNANRKLTQNEVYAIELGFITCFMSKFNQAGVNVWYKLPKI